MVRFQDHRISKPVPSRFRSRSMNNPVRTTNINTKVSIFAHTHFSPTEPNRSVDDLMEISIHTERRDSPALMVASLNSAADDWECKDCSWKLRMLAGKFNLKFHAKRNEGPTSSPAAYETLDLGSLAIDSPPTPPSSDSSRSSSPLPDEIVSLKRQTLTNDAGEGQPFYGVHQAHLDLSLGESVTVHMRPTDLKRNRYELKPGTIISAPFHSQYRDSTVSTSNYNTAVSGFGAVYSKYRKMVILETWADHVVCLPMYSYNGRGLENRQGMVDEYIDIRDADEEYHEPSDTPHEPLLATRGKEWAGKNTFISGKTVIKMTEKTAHNMFQKCSIEGKIEREHFRRLYKLYLGLVQTKVLEFFGEPIDSMVIVTN
ncbi:hypothetical protein BKA59DRAFT_533392 [Fusarium tricinctum]|uniref:DUF6590 domain-containing protein n=1 Tax=Fusarium tricinctum TaxID=61284 RepID=A0A8K0RNE6_9HYPO|nr:hypothetical protein BKA59DRAFT_533392 [Fusarium tricinctum]